MTTDNTDIIETTETTETTEPRTSVVLVGEAPMNAKDYQAYAEATQLNWAWMIIGQIGLVPVAEGDPGTGKSETANAIAVESRRRFQPYELSKTYPEELGGFPVKTEITLPDGSRAEVMKYVPDERLLRAYHEPTLILLDELTNISQAKQTGAMRLVQYGIPGCWIFGACNPEQLATEGIPLTPPFMNRIWMGAWERDDVAHDIASANVLKFPKPVIPIVPNNYMDYHPRWGLAKNEYLTRWPENRHRPPTQTESPRPWPSNRQWTNVERSLSAAEACHATKETLIKVANGFLGADVGTVFIEFATGTTFPSPHEMLHGNFDLPDRTDGRIACIQSLVNYVRRDRNQENLKALEEFQTKLQDADQELAAFSANAFLSVLTDDE